MEAEVMKNGHRPLGFGAAVVRQFRLLWISRRPLLLGIAVLAVLVLAGEPWTNDPRARLLTFWPLWVALVGPVWAFAVFYQEGPSNRLYHWSLPVGRATHTLARLAAGVLWLWIIYAVLILAAAGVAAADGDLWQMGEIGASGWLNLFTGPLMGYLAVSLLTMASDYPVRWFFAILLLIPLTLSIIDEVLNLQWLAEVLLEPFSNGAWGFIPVMIGGLGAAAMRVEWILSGAASGAGPTGNPLAVEHWWVAMPLWILLLLGLVAYVASRHPDALPRLRRSG